MKQNRKNAIWIIAMAPLLAGIVFYLLFREPILVSTWLGIEEYHFHHNVKYLNWFPSFVHQFSFILLSWLALGREHKWFVLSLWSLLNGLAEIGQALEGSWLSFSPSILKNYFKNGSYSHEDMLAIVLATVVAYLVIDKYEKRI